MNDVEYYTRLASEMSELRLMLHKQLNEAVKAKQEKRVAYIENTIEFLGKMIDAANEEIHDA